MKSEIELRRDLWSHMSKSPFLMVGLEGVGHSEPLTAQLDKDQVDTLWFFVGRGNRVARGGAAMAQFVAKGHNFFACLSGDIAVDDDPAMIDKLWSNAVEAWFPGGRNDPDLTLVRFEIRDAELWETDMTAGGLLKMLLGKAIDPADAGSHARTSTTAVKE